MNPDQTSTYIDLLERTLSLFEQKQANQQKLMKNPQGSEREIYLDNIQNVDSKIEIQLEKLKRLKSDEA